MGDRAATEFVERFALFCNISIPSWELNDKAGEIFLTIEVGSINEYFVNALATVREELSDNEYANQVFLKAKTPRSWLRSLEAQILQKILAESITVGKSTLQSDFYGKVIPFLGGEERRIYSAVNHVVFGRRGAGKSSLVLYACLQAQQSGRPFAWIALQQYSGRDDLLVIPQVLYEIIDSASCYPLASPERIDRLRKGVFALEEKGEALTKKEINQFLPVFARDFLPFVQSYKQFYLFLDDLHLLHPNIQPYFLSVLYSFARGNNIFLKITAIENLTTLQHEGTKEGLQTPGDAQVIYLDYNLMDPGQALNHTQKILEGYIKYTGIPGTTSIVAAQNVVERLVWASAGVPRDALYIFNNAIKKALAAGRSKIAVTDINMAAADSLTEKERYISDSVAEDASLIVGVVDDLKEFCLQQIRTNAFLVRLDNSDPKYRLIKKISDLRFLHILHTGITPGRAGEKYEAYMLDYAFYTGFRRTTSVKEFQSKPERPSVKKLRTLKSYSYKTRQVFESVGS